MLVSRVPKPLPIDRVHSPHGVLHPFDTLLGLGGIDQQELTAALVNKNEGQGTS